MALAVWVTIQFRTLITYLGQGRPLSLRKNYPWLQRSPARRRRDAGGPQRSLHAFRQADPPTADSAGSKVGDSCRVASGLWPLSGRGAPRPLHVVLLLPGSIASRHRRVGGDVGAFGVALRAGPPASDIVGSAGAPVHERSVRNARHRQLSAVHHGRGLLGSAGRVAYR